MDEPAVPAGALMAEGIRDSSLLALMGYLPVGWLIDIFDTPWESGRNALRLAGLWLAALGCVALEYRMLSRRLLDNVRAAPGAGRVHLSLAPIFRRARRLSPWAYLWLIELETLMRLGWYRVAMIVTLFSMALLQTGSTHVVVLTVVMAANVFLSPRNYSFGFAYRSIGERFLMPLRLTAPASAYNAALSVLPVVAISVMIGWTCVRVGWPGLPVFCLWLVMPFCVLVGEHGAGIYRSARFPVPFDFTPYSVKMPTSVVWTSVVFNVVIIGLPMLLAFLVPRVSWGPAAAVGGASVLVVGAVVFNSRMSRAADGLVRSDPFRILRSLARDG